MVELFYKVDADIVGIGLIGPYIGVLVEEQLADWLIEKDGNYFIKTSDDDIEIQTKEKD